MKTYKAGQMLRNGAIVIDYTNDVVLAVVSNGTAQPYVTWAIDLLGNTTSGDYFTDLDRAVKGFKVRAS